MELFPLGGNVKSNKTITKVKDNDEEITNKTLSKLVDELKETDNIDIKDTNQIEINNNEESRGAESTNNETDYVSNDNDSCVNEFTSKLGPTINAIKKAIRDERDIDDKEFTKWGKYLKEIVGEDGASKDKDQEHIRGNVETNKRKGKERKIIKKYPRFTQTLDKAEISMNVGRGQISQQISERDKNKQKKSTEEEEIKYVAPSIENGRNFNINPMIKTTKNQSPESSLDRLCI